MTADTTPTEAGACITNESTMEQTQPRGLRRGFLGDSLKLCLPGNYSVSPLSGIQKGPSGVLLFLFPFFKLLIQLNQTHFTTIVALYLLSISSFLPVLGWPLGGNAPGGEVLPAPAGEEDLLEVVPSTSNHAHRNSSVHATSSKEKLTMYCRCRLIKLNELCNLSDALKSEMSELHDLHCIMSELKHQLDTTHVRIVREILEEGVSNGEFKKINKDNIELVAYLMVSSFRGLAVPLMVSQSQSPRLDLQIDSIVDIMVEGIGR